MRVDELKSEYNLEEVHMLPYGSFFFFDDFIISEINEGVLFNWEKAKKVIDLAYAHYGPNPELVYISNRINSYSVVPQDWLKFFSNKHPLVAMAVVAKSKKSTINLKMEKLFFFSNIKKFNDLEEAIAWSRQLIRLKKSSQKK